MLTLFLNQDKMSSNERETMASAMFDRTYTGGLGLMAVRTLSETSSLTIMPSFTESRQDDETSDDFQSYSLFLGYDTIFKNQSLSPYLSLGKTDYDDDADSFSIAAGISGSFSVGDRHSFGYGYTFLMQKVIRIQAIRQQKTQMQLVTALHLVMV